MIGADEIAFVVCVENNRLAAQALLLCESIRAFAGAYGSAPIIAISPRPHLALDVEMRARLEALGATYVVEPLNLTGSPYGTINRIVASAWAEANLSQPYLVVLDTDTVFVRPPAFRRADVGVRPVDGKGSASAGEGDPLDAYWRQVCKAADISLDTLPRLSPSMDDISIRASYNGGFTIADRRLGVFAQTERVFFETFSRDLRPLRGRGAEVYASTGFVGADASEWWGSSQAALSAAIWSRTSDVLVYDSGYNIPANWLVGSDRCWLLDSVESAVLVHYHHLTQPNCRADFLNVLRQLSCPDDAVRFVEQRLERFD